VATVFGAQGVKWIADFPKLLADLADRWQLSEIGDPFEDASVSFVAPATGAAGRQFVLKVSPRLESIAREGRTLDRWHGRGAVRLASMDVARGALLLERTIPGDPLTGLAMTDDRRATHIASGVIRTLQAEPEPPPDLPAIEESWLASLSSPAVATGSSRLRHLCGAARRMADDLLAVTPARVALHGDLHHDNILRAEGDTWIAADPHGIVGPREAEAAALLRNPRRLVLAHQDQSLLMRQRIAIVAADLAWDPWRIAAWGFVGAVVAAAWSCQDGEGSPEIEKWLTCARALQAAGDTAKS
jgi:streptomycin 6-kinase